MVLEKFKLTSKRIAQIYLSIHKRYDKFEPDIFIDYQSTNDKFVFGYDSNEPIATELVAIIFREKILRVLASLGFPPTIDKDRKDWIINFTNHNLMKQTLFIDTSIDEALCSACQYLLDQKLIKEDQ